MPFVAAGHGQPFAAGPHVLTTLSDPPAPATHDFLEVVALLGIYWINPL
jgi:hypothetical protein